MKIKCTKCNNFAVWAYPNSECWTEDNRYFCDDCVNRGCFCQINNGVETLDNKGRLLPCIDYSYNARGFYK